MSTSLALSHLSSVTLADIQQAALSTALAPMGWECTELSIDMVTNTARMCLKSNEGRLVTFDSRNGRTSITREQMGVATVAVGRRGDRFIAERATTSFLGRTRCLGIRSGLRTLADYIADNSSVSRQFARAPFAALLGSATDATEVSQ